MKTLVTVLGLSILSLLLMSSSSHVVYPKAKFKSFQVGEMLRYKVSYGFVDAGEAILTVNATHKKGANARELIHVKGIGRTLGAFNAFFKVRDKYESYLDTEGVFPWYFVRRVQEGSYKKSQDYTFMQDQKKVDTGKKIFDVPLGVQDMLSSFYYARTLDFGSMKPGDVTTFKCFMDDEVYPLHIRFEGIEEVKIRKGKFECMKFVPVVQEGRYFENDEDVQFWVTNDRNRIPLLVKAKIPVGTVKMHLVEWDGLVEDL
ncbi:MAG: DUF3108 domain-containing protein [Crocinitomicaceae bacterium]|jgi:hypothetical protein|nr:DUF3108 domain-containing protein [Crocinitomicaceae bacterium]